MNVSYQNTKKKEQIKVQGKKLRIITLSYTNCYSATLQFVIRNATYFHFINSAFLYKTLPLMFLTKCPTKCTQNPFQFLQNLPHITYFDKS
jgi:hypothetical protein